jgi:hypothetical protein
LVVPLGIWEPPDGPGDGDWEVPRDAVAGLVDNTMTRFRVIGFYADVAYWESFVNAWSVE